MSVNATTTGTKKPAAATQQAAPAAAQQQTNQQAGAAFMPVFGLQTRLSAFGSGGEQFEKLFENISKKIKFLNEEVKTEEKYAVVKLLKQNAGLNYSAIVVAESFNGVVAAHILMIEKTGDYPEKLIETIAGTRYEITRTPADALDDKYVSQAQAAVAEAMKVDLASVIVTDGTLVPNEFDVTSEVMVNDLIQNTFNATHSEVNIRVNDYKGINLSQLIQQNRNGKFLINMYFNQEDAQFFDQTGMPVRQDVCIALSYKLNNNPNQRSINQGDDTFDIVKTYGYIDFEWQPTMVNGMIGSQKFVPNFIITHIESKVAPTPDIAFLGVASIFALNEDMNWMQAFRPTPGKKNEIDFNDIGALNIEGNIELNQTGFGKKIGTKDKTFTVVDLNNYIQRLVRPNILVSIDVPKAGPETWFLSALQYIKFRNSKDAYARVMDYINTMTNGAFATGSFQMFDGATNKIHGGFYKSSNGSFKDVRHLNSYLGFANFIADTNQSPALIAQYTNTLYNSSIPTELRCAERKKYIDEMSNKSAVYKQYYDRLTFNSGFLMQLLGALRNVGFAPLFSNMGAMNDMFQRRSTADFSGAMLGMDARILGQTNLYGSFFGMPQGYARTF